MKFWLLVCLLMCSASFGSSLSYGKNIELTEKNHVAIRGVIDSNSISGAESQLLLSKEKELYMYIDSPGGSVFDGLRLVRIMKASGKKITCLANTAVSMAFYIFQMCDVKLITKEAILMQHVMSYGLEGNEPNNYTFSKFIRSIAISMDKQQAKLLGLSYTQFRSKVRDDWWMYGEDGLKNKAASDIVSVSCSKELVAAVNEFDIPMLFWSVKVKFSKCPLLVTPLKSDAKQIRQGDGAGRELVNLYRNFDPRATVKRKMK